MNRVPLTDVFISSRAGHWGTEPGTSDVDVRVIRNGDVLDNGDVRWAQLPVRGLRARDAASAIVEQDDLLITTSGECGYVAYVRKRPDQHTCATNFVRVLKVARNRAVPRYVFHFMNRAGFRESLTPFVRGTTMKNLAVADAFARALVPMPPLREQRRIAEVLDQAEALRAKRRSAMELLDNLRSAIFLDLFGDTSAWPTSTVSDVAGPEDGSIRTGPFGSQLLHSEFTENGVAVLGIDNVVSNDFTWSERRYISLAKYAQLRRYTVRPGDVLITIMGTCGRCAVVPEDVPLAINTKHLCCITLDRSKCLPSFLQAYFLHHPAARAYLAKRAKGAIMAGLNMGIISAMPISVPPMQLQLAFEERLAVLQGMRNAHQRSLESLDALNSSLQQSAFTGDL